MQNQAETSASGRLTKLWTTSGFHDPECAVVDRLKQQIYLSCMASDADTLPTGRGHVARLSMDGEVLEAQWITGLQVPCGLAVRGTRLYIVDSNRLLVYDTGTGGKIAEHAAPEAVFLDGMGFDESGEDIYVSDIAGNAIWRLSGPKWERWLQTPRLDFPDGMVAERDRLVVGTYGLWKAVHGWSPGTTSDHKGHLIAIDYKTKEITDIGDGAPLAHHDGLCSDGKDGYITSDFVYSRLLHVDARGRPSVLIEFDAMENDSPGKPREGFNQVLASYGSACGPSDIRHYPDLGLLLVPLLTVGKLAAYRYEP